MIHNNFVLVQNSYFTIIDHCLGDPGLETPAVCDARLSAGALLNTVQLPKAGPNSQLTTD